MFYNFNQTGPGLPANLTKKEGFALYLDILYREFWGILALNFYFFLFCLPVFTIGASYAALCSVLIRMIRDVPVNPFEDFRIAFKENFKQSTGVFFIQVAIFFLMVLNFEFYTNVNPFALIILGVVALFLYLSGLYTVPILVSVKLSTKYVLKNSFFLMFLSIKYTLLSGLVNGLHLLFLIFLYPYSTPYFLLFAMSFLTFTTCFLAYYGIVKYCYQKEEGEDITPEETKPLTHAEEMAALDAELKAIQEEMATEENSD